jgi:hypothetical protein
MSDPIQEILDRFQIQTLYYHCHIDNFPFIVIDGKIMCRNLVREHEPSYVDISDLDVQSNRTPWHGYVPLYFSKKTPTLYVQTVSTSQYGRNPREGQLNDNIVFFDINPLPIFQTSGIKFTDGNAAKGATRVYSDLSDLDKLNWIYIRAINEHGENPQLTNPSKPNSDIVYDPEFRRIKSSEVLVPNQIPFNHKYVRRIVVASPSAEQNIRDFYISREIDCVIDRSYYFWH